jgi:hypothetical protein
MHRQQINHAAPQHLDMICLGGKNILNIFGQQPITHGSQATCSDGFMKGLMKN